jgi:hypothetical protein
MAVKATLAQRFAIFFGGCVLVRLVFVLVAARVPARWLPLLGVLALLPGLGFIYIHASKRNQTGAVFGEPAWWDGLRPVHGAMYLAFAALAIFRVELAWTVLAADLALGVAAFLYRYLVVLKGRVPAA